MKFGPFTARDIRRIEPVLADRQVSYEITFEEQELDAKVDEWRHQPVGAILTRTAWLDTSCYYIEIPDKDLRKLGSELENYAIADYSQSAQSL